jgi:membrane-bound lytic murein transglycosylase C
MNEFYKYKQSQTNDFESYKKAQQKAFEEYKKEVGVFWEKPKLSSKKEWVAYSKDKKTRSDVNFYKNQITIETIAKNKNSALKKLQHTLAKVVTIDTKNAIEKDPLIQKLKKIKKPSNVIDSKIDSKPILAPVVFKTNPSLKDLKRYVYKNVNQKNIEIKKSTKIKNEFIYKVVVKLPNDTTYKRSKFYENEVRENASRQKLPLSLVFAIMHTESSFNPHARSYIPAYGLMQIVPHTAGVDSYRYLYRVKKIPSGIYLYNAKNNIRLGSAYLHILYYKYLKDIKNPQSRLYCAIAAYNTGAGNVAWAFTRSYNPKKAAKIINKLTPQEVYNHLLRDLKYNEAKNYLKKVTKRMNIYHKIYQG